MAPVEQTISDVLRAPFAPEDVHVLAVRIPSRVAWPVTFTALLSTDERTRLATFVDRRAQTHFVVGRVLLRGVLALRQRTGAREIVFTYGARGKPGVSGMNVGFNLAHAGAWILLALAAAPHVGVDVECRMTTAQAQMLGPRLRADLPPAGQQARPERPSEIQRLWVRKEAVLKARGVGFGFRADDPAGTQDDFGPAAPATVHDWEIGRGTRAAVAVMGTARARLVRYRPRTLSTMLVELGSPDRQRNES